MKINTAKTKLTFWSVLAILSYCSLLFSSAKEGWDDFKLGFEEGYTLKLQTYFVDLKAKASISTFPDSITNLTTGNKVNIRYDKAQVRAAIIPVSEKSIETFQIVESVLAIIIFFICISIPILFFKLMKSLIREVIFDKRNIRYMRIIAGLLLLYYTVNVIANYVSYKMNVAMFNFADYTIQRESTDMIWLLIGIVILLFAEILSKGSLIQEEQDLTI